jgi:hypothetical protein
MNGNRSGLVVWQHVFRRIATPCWAAAALAIAATPIWAADKPLVPALRVSPAALIAAAKAATLARVDYSREACRETPQVGLWLETVVRSAAKTITWSGGRCRLINEHNPLDAGTRWCAQAEIKPKRGGEPATIEVYFEAPRRGRPGAAFAFRAVVHTKDGWDYMRETRAFEDNWRETYAADDALPDDPCK